MAARYINSMEESTAALCELIGESEWPIAAGYPLITDYDQVRSVCSMVDRDSEETGHY